MRARAPRALAPIALIAPALCASPAAAEPPPVQAIFHGEVDARLHSAERVEGEDGFAVARLRLGARAQPAPWFLAAAMAEWAQEKPALLDAYASVRPNDEWELSVGSRKTPLFHSARDEAVWLLPIPERSMLARAFWPRRDVGLEVHRLPTAGLPVEAWLRAGNGSGSVLGNDNSDYAVDARVDVVLGRAARGAPATQLLGLRLGGGLHAESAEDRPGVQATNAGGFLFYRPQTVDGPRRVVEAHLAAYAGPVKLTAEAAFARESRSKDTDGNPDTPRVDQDPVMSSGASLEIAWMAIGAWRRLNEWPSAPPGGPVPGALEIAARIERLDLAYGARDVAPGGATAGAAAVRWWAAPFAALSVAGYVTLYDVPPIESPGATQSWLGLARATFHVPLRR